MVVVGKSSVTQDSDECLHLSKSDMRREFWETLPTIIGWISVRWNAATCWGSIIADFPYPWPRKAVFLIFDKFFNFSLEIITVFQSCYFFLSLKCWNLSMCFGENCTYWHFELIVNKVFELNWIGLNWTELNWVQLNRFELNWTELNQIESNWVELNWIERTPGFTASHSDICCDP